MKVINPTISDKGLLEPIVMKVTRWVLRREGGGDSSDLSYMMNFTKKTFARVNITFQLLFLFFYIFYINNYI